MGRQSRYAFDLWDALAAALEQIVVTDYQQENLSPEEVNAAHQAYSREFQRIYKKLKARDDE